MKGGMDSISALEHSALARRPEALAMMLRIYRALATGTELRTLAPGEPPATDEVLATRIAAASATILADPATAPDDATLAQLAVLGRTVDNLHALSGFGTADHILRLLGATDTASLAALAARDPAAFRKAALLLPIDSQLPIDAEALFAGPPGLVLLAVLNLLCAKPIATEAGHARRDRLLALAERLPAASLPGSVDHLVLLGNAWMLCSYAEARNKHAIKRVLNRVLREWVLRHGMRDATLPAERRLVARPTILFAAEIMHGNHVQYRYFGQYLRQLATRFRLVLLTEEHQADAHARALFEETITFKRGLSPDYLKTVAERITAVAPDIIFWPSVGMRHWGPPLANLRLAPIQMTALGHSASTFCDTIDYYLTEEGYVADPSLFGERVVLLPDASLRFEASPHYRPLAPQLRERPSPLRVALPSNLLKLNPRFIGILRRIAREAGRPVQFHIFPNTGGLELAATRRALATSLPGAAVYPVLGYGDYLARLNQCDINLSPFPFGGLHSVIDSLRQGLPVVALEGDEPHARTDSMLLRRLGMPEWLIARDEESYVAAALRVIRDDALRLDLSRQALALDIDRVMFGDVTTPLGTEVAEAVWWIYRHHEAAMASGIRAFSVGDRAGFG
jgi:hypothetical protein